MLDIRLLRENPESVKQRLLNKGADCGETVDRILVLDVQRREWIGRRKN